MAEHKMPPELLAKFKADREEKKAPSGDEVKMRQKRAKEKARSFKEKK